MRRELPSGIDWHEQTRLWWDAWVTSPITDDWTELQWLQLADTALVHSAVWGGDLTRTPELRVRVERLGGVPVQGEATPILPSGKPRTALDELEARRARRAGS